MKKMLRTVFCALILSCSTLVSAQLYLGNQMSEEYLADAVPAISSFLNTWLVEQDIVRASEYFAIREPYRAQILSDYQLTDPAEVSAWTKKMLVLLLANDKNVLSSAKMKGSKNFAGYVALPEEASGVSGLVHPNKVTDVLKNQTFVLFKRSIVVQYNFAHTVGGDLSLVFEKVEGVWKVAHLSIRIPGKET